MADNELGYKFKCEDIDGEMTFTSVDQAKTEIDFSAWDLTLGTPAWTLTDTNTRLCLTWAFTDAQQSDQMTVHNKLVNNEWALGTTRASYDDSYSYFKVDGATLSS